MSIVTSTTTTLQVTVVCAGALTTTATLATASTEVGLPGVLDGRIDCHYQY